MYRKHGEVALSLLLLGIACKVGDEPFAQDNAATPVVITPSAASIRLVSDGSGGTTPTATFKLVASDPSGRPREGAHVDVQIGYCDRSQDVAVREQSMDTRLLLQAGEGCLAQSSSLLQCILGVNGAASFSATGAISSVAKGPFLAVPVRAFPSGIWDESRCSEATVTVTTGLPAGTTLNVAIATTPTVVSPTVLACDTATPIACGGTRAWPVTASLVGPSGAHVSMDSVLSVELSLVGASADVWFSPDSSCSEPAQQRARAVIAPIDQDTGFLRLPLALCTSARAATLTVAGSVTSAPGAVSLFTSVPVVVTAVPARLLSQTLPTSGQVVFAAYDCEGRAVQPMAMPGFQQAGNLLLSATNVTEAGTAGLTVQFTNAVPGVPIEASYGEAGGRCAVRL